MSEGLILLTNNGDLARHLEHPSSGYKRVYELELYGEVFLSSPFHPPFAVKLSKKRPQRLTTKPNDDHDDQRRSR